MSGRNHFLRFSISATAMLAIAMLGGAYIHPALAQEGPLAGPPVAMDTAPPSVTDDVEDLSKMLPLLMSSPDRKKFASELEAAIRQGDLETAEKNLNAAVELGALAVILSDRLQDPNLLPSLQALGPAVENDPTPTDKTHETAEPAICVPGPAPDPANLLDLQEALEREKAQGSAAAQELAALAQEHRSLTSRLESDAAEAASRMAELQSALQREQERGETATRELASLQEEHRNLQALQTRTIDRTKTMVADLEAMVQQDREHSADLTRQLASAQDELCAHQASQASQAESNASLVNELKEALAREKVRGEALTRELADTIELIEELRTAREAQEQSATPLMLRMEDNGVQAPAPPVPEEQATAVPQSLPAAAAIMPPPTSEPAGPKVASASPLQDLGLTRALPPSEIVQPPVAVAPPAAAETVSPASAPDDAASGKAETPVASPKVDDRLMIRAEELIRTGDVSGARLLLERSMEDGNAQAAFRLAETYDPQILARRGVLGIRGDAAKARELYARARAWGIAQAGERMEALK